MEDWAAPSVAAEKEDGFRLCTVLLDMKFGVMLHGFLVFQTSFTHDPHCHGTCIHTDFECFSKSVTPIESYKE